MRISSVRRPGLYCVITWDSCGTLKSEIAIIETFKKLRRWRQGKRQESNRFNEKNNNSARASRFFVHFFAIPARDQILSLLENASGKAINSTWSLSEFGRGPLSLAPTKIPFF